MSKTSKIILITIIMTSILLGLGYAAIQNITLNIAGTAVADPNQSNFKVKFTGTPAVSDSTYVTANITGDTTADVVVFGANNFGITNINGQGTESNNSINNIIFSSYKFSELITAITSLSSLKDGFKCIINE